jgi:hypothetical protein
MPIINTSDLRKGPEGEFKNASQLPATFVGTIQKIEQKKDKQGQEALFLSIHVDNTDTYTVQKYTDTIKRVLADHLETLGISSLVEGQRFEWTRSREGRSVYERYFPVGMPSAPSSKQ